MEVCYKVFKREVLDHLNLKSNRFGFEPEFTMKVAQSGFRIYEVPVVIVDEPTPGKRSTGVTELRPSSPFLVPILTRGSVRTYV
jgi:hypothetical protein